MAKVIVPIADGTEEIEAVTVIDVLRRAGAEVCVASITGQLQVKASRGVGLVADALFEQCFNQSWDLVVIPGGLPGSEASHDSPELVTLLSSQLNKGGLVAAICAAPAVVLGRHGLIQDYTATSNPAFQQELSTQVKSLSKEPVVQDRNLITSQAPGTAMAFALCLVERLYGQKLADEVAGPMVV